MHFPEPLSDAEFDELDEFLVSDATPDDCMDISMLDGFLTAIVIGPVTLLPSQWLPHVWGETAEQPMQWQSDEQAERVIGLVFRYMNDLIWQLEHDAEHYEPLTYEREDNGEIVPIIDEWCCGFVQGTLIDTDAWNPLLESSEHQALLEPILLYGTEQGWDELEAKPELAERHDEFVVALPDNVLAIRDYWLPQRKAATTFRHDAAPPGRNDLCPCGSGKKFKKCCGDPARLH